MSIPLSALRVTTLFSTTRLDSLPAPQKYWNAPASDCTYELS